MSDPANSPHLGHLLSDAAAAHPRRIAVEDEHGRSLTYAELDRRADRLTTRLARWGIGREDRVGLFLPKSLESVVSVHGILRSGAAYVPIDATAPPARGAGILADAWARAAIVSPAGAMALQAHWPAARPMPRLIVVGDTHGAEAASWDEIQADDSHTPLAPRRDIDDLAYILYTSGSTGRPKGVMITHAAAACFLDWCDATLGLRDGERFASHAPFHFDLSTFDLFACCRNGGRLRLIGEALGKDPARLGAHLAENPVDVWYSAPSILALLALHGGLERPGFPAPRVALFAGEVFPILHLRRLRALWPDAAMWNLYGPTETNVCTAHPVPRTIPPERIEPLPIGTVCPPLRGRLIDAAGRSVPPGAEGELLIAGPGVMRGYFGRPDLDAKAFLVDDEGERWYRTGDVVVDDGSGCYTFRGRRDRMIKKRGFRIELGEIESALHRHDDVERAAVVARAEGEGVVVSAFVSMKPGRKGSIIAMKRHCTEHLPHYMVPDRIAFLDALPQTSTDKVDYQRLTHLA